MEALLSSLAAAAPLGAALGLGYFLRRTRVCSPADGEVSGPRDTCRMLLACAWAAGSPTRRCLMLPACRPPQSLWPGSRCPR